MVGRRNCFLPLPHSQEGASELRSLILRSMNSLSWGMGGGEPKAMPSHMLCCSTLPFSNPVKQVVCCNGRGGVRSDLALSSCLFSIILCQFLVLKLLCVQRINSRMFQLHSLANFPYIIHKQLFLQMNVNSTYTEIIALQLFYAITFAGMRRGEFRGL